MKLEDVCRTLDENTKLLCIHACKSDIDEVAGDIRNHRRYEYLKDFKVIRMDNLKNIRVVKKYTSPDKMYIENYGDCLVCFYVTGEQDEDPVLLMEKLDIEEYVKTYNQSRL